MLYDSPAYRFQVRSLGESGVGKHIYIKTASHCTYCLQLVITGWLEVANGEGQPSTCISPAGWIQGPGESHRYTIAPNSRILYAHFTVSADQRWPDEAFKGRFNLDLPRRNAYVQPSPKAVWGHETPSVLPEQLAKFLVMHCEDLLRWFNGADESLRRMAEQLLHGVILQWACQGMIAQHTSSEPADIDSDPMLQVFSLLNAMGPNIDSVSKMAARVGVSTRWLNYHYKKQSGRTIEAAIIDKRMERAAGHLKNPKLTLAQIAKRVGYSDISGFSRTFKRHFKCTPGAYRKRLQRQK